ncbi:hypothetical protein BYT27DRAFT_7334103 [Phlegmacium glaucopus]|nr:hypothetical protein BYT27DRAFT_7334103 [Phlegmacium glaucopus]
MSSERPSKNNRVTKAIRYVKGKFSSPVPLSHPATPLSIDADPTSDNRMVTTDAGTRRAAEFPVISVDHAATAVMTADADTVSLPNSVPVPASTPSVPRQLGSASNPGPEIPSTDVAPMSAFQGAHDVRLHNSTINMANAIHIHVPSNADGDEQLNSRVIDALLHEKLLPRAQFAEYDAACPRNACTENTRKAILDSLRVWASDDTTTEVYWLNGMAGTGKTTIAYSFSEILHEMGSLGGTFFSSHFRADTSDVHCIIPTISLQLAKYLPSLPQLILDVVKTDPSTDCISWRISKQFLNFMVRPLTAYKDSIRGGVVPVIVLDALDECSDQSLVAELLSVISKYSKSLPVKFFITSRPEIVLKETFDHSWDHSNFILHEVEKEIVKADIELYIKACLLGGQVKYNKHDWPPQAELESLVNMSGTLFIYAATVCKYIAQKGSSSMPQRLSDVVNMTLEATSDVTHPLDILYERILDAAYAFTNKKEREKLDMVLTAVVYVYNPLSMTAISDLMEMPIEHIVAALSSLHSLICIPSQDHDMPISTFHASFYDFISNQIVSSKHYLDPCISHRHLALQCLSLMEKEWSEEERVSYLAERRCGDISESLAYACGSWVSHFTYADNNNEIDELKHFFQRHLLRWMDCLSILGRLGMAMHSLHELESCTNAEKLLKVTVIDAERFLKENYDFIKNNSLEGCPSALVWLPEKSDIWKTYGSGMDCPWKLCFGRRKAWSLTEAVLRHSAKVKSAVFSPDGIHIVSASWDSTAQIWNTATGEHEAELKHSELVNSAVFSPDGMHIVSASYDNSAQIWNAATGECEAELKGHSGRVNSAVFSPNGMHIVSASFDNTARIWNTATGECEAELKGHSGWVNSAVFSPDSRQVVSASFDKTARIWNTATGECKAELKGHSKRVNSAVFSANGMHIVSASYDNTARIWNTATGDCEAELKGHSGWVNSAVFSPDGIHIVSASNDNTVWIWNTATGECEAELKGHSGRVNSAVFSPDGKYIMSASEDSTVQIWNIGTRKCKAELKGHSRRVNSAVFSPDGMHIVSASEDNTARIWNTAIGECEAEPAGHSKRVNSAVFSPDGMHIVSASNDNTASIWNTVTGQCEAELEGHSGWVESAVFSPDGMHIVSASRDNTARIWNTATRKCEAELRGHSGWVNSAVFSPDGMHIVSASRDGTARIWNTATGECEAELEGHSGCVNSAVFSSDGMHIVSASNDTTVWIWNTATGVCEAELKGHLECVNSAIFSPDGMHIVSTSDDNKVWIWNTATGECEAELNGHMYIPSISDNSQLPGSSSIPDGIYIHHHAHGQLHASIQLSFLDIYQDTIFHTLNHSKIWIASPFHQPTSVSYHLSKICLGYATGKILLLEFKWPAAFSVLNGPRFSQPSNVPLRNDKLHCHKTLWGLSGHRLTTRNVRRDAFSNTTYSAPLSTSTHILQTGLNKIWRKFQPSKNKPSTQAYPSYSSGSRASFFSASDKQPEQDVVDYSKPMEAFTPRLAESQPDPPTPACHQYSPASPVLSSSLLDTPTERQAEQDVVHHSKPVEAFGPQLAEPKPDLPTPACHQHSPASPALSCSLPAEMQPEVEAFRAQLAEPKPDSPTPTCHQHSPASPALSSFLLGAPTEKQPEGPIARHLKTGVAPDQVTPRHDVTSIFDMEDLNPVPTWRSARIVETDFDRILNNLGSRSSEFTLTIQPSWPATALFAIQNIATPRQKQIVIYQPKPIRAFNPVPQLALAALNALKLTPSPSVDNLYPFPSGQHTVFQPLTEYTMSTEPNSGINPLSLAMVSSSRVAQNQYSHQQSTPFVPSPKQAKRKLSFRPFSPEEDTISLPPSQSNYLGIADSIWSLDHDFSVNTGSSLLLSPIFLGLPQPFEVRPSVQAGTLAPPSNQLKITITVPEGYFNADDCRDRVARFLFARAGQLENSLVVVWQESFVDSAGTEGFNFLKTLFVHLDKAMLNSSRTALSSFSRLAITIPDCVKPVTSCYGLGQCGEDDGIDLANASGLLEFSWHGDFNIFAKNFINFPCANLTVLDVTSSHISLDDAATLLHSFPELEEISIGTIQDNNTGDGVLFKPSSIYQKALPNVARLSLDSVVALHSLLARVAWTPGPPVELSFTLRENAILDVMDFPLPWQMFSDITFNCHFTQQDLSQLRDLFPRVKYNDIGPD